MSSDLSKIQNKHLRDKALEEINSIRKEHKVVGIFAVLVVSVFLAFLLALFLDLITTPNRSTFGGNFIAAFVIALIGTTLAFLAGTSKDQEGAIQQVIGRALEEEERLIAAERRKRFDKEWERGAPAREVARRKVEHHQKLQIAMNELGKRQEAASQEFKAKCDERRKQAAAAASYIAGCFADFVLACDFQGISDEETIVRRFVEEKLVSVLPGAPENVGLAREFKGLPPAMQAVANHLPKAPSPPVLRPVVLPKDSILHSAFRK